MAPIALAFFFLPRRCPWRCLSRSRGTSPSRWPVHNLTMSGRFMWADCCRKAATCGDVHMLFLRDHVRERQGQTRSAGRQRLLQAAAELERSCRPGGARRLMLLWPMPGLSGSRDLVLPDTQ
jgi:hypothetical protein